MTALKTLRTLIGYILCGLLFVWPFVILSVFALAGSTWAFNSLHSIDVAICSICHGTKLESISARSFRLSHDKRYRYQMLVIDFLARPFDGDNHCRRAHKWESKVIKLR
ncbi:hypothetical protein PNIG_a1545 [Pseudoalteromonas nigrifaciens]|uniref:Uncharacterized protein n=1 Tax=Pseudoalteromonas nigrifaciens TaxID=28109 RepID=A0AAC9UHY8_9GAMM|nr:hypothetical protein [Pseudoalteromonas nigrifaciens]ASM53694.1 hypothetical protein PNIG_a1545 [Pseudoalteromonas nigrifaciens]GEN40687.1 hypothetical protein PNI02_01530 [Pseudoalteromonas nigrifaciens]